MELVTNLSFIQAAAVQLMSPKPCGYNSHEIWGEIAKQPQMKCETISISYGDHCNQQFNCIYFSNKLKPIQPCIVYLHGLSSYCFEGLYLLQHLQNNINLCLYDLRGHGKNKCSQVTYGLREASDLYQLVKQLNSRGIEEIYLWGRSMGASTILHFLNSFGLLSTISSCVKLVIVDSPYSSFEQIAKQTIGSSLGIPSFVCSPLISAVMAHVQQKQKINLQALNFQSLSKVKCPALFIYSSVDEIVNCSHSEKILKKYGGKSYVIKGQFPHNDPRPPQLISEVLRFIRVKQKQAVRNSDIMNTSMSKKGLSLSLISAKNIKDKENRSPSPSPSPIKPKHQKNKKSLSPKPALKIHQENKSFVNIKQSSPIRKSTILEDEKIESIQNILQTQCQKSKHQLKSKPALSNRLYL